MIKFRTCILVRPAGVTTEEIVAAFGRVVLATQECVRLDRVDAEFDAAEIRSLVCQHHSDRHARDLLW
jgi:hypothetical protein